MWSGDFLHREAHIGNLMMTKEFRRLRHPDPVGKECGTFDVRCSSFSLFNEAPPRGGWSALRSVSLGGAFQFFDEDLQDGVCALAGGDAGGDHDGWRGGVERFEHEAMGE